MHAPISLPARLNAALTLPGRHLTSFLADAAERWPTQTLTLDGLEFTYEKAWFRVLQIATWLQQNGVSKGDRVLTVIRHSPDLHLISLAVAHIGAVISVLSLETRTAAFTRIIEESQPTCVFLEQSSRHLKAAVPEALTVWMESGLSGGGWEEADFIEVSTTAPAWGMPFPGTSADPAVLVYANSSSHGVLLSHDRVCSMLNESRDSGDGLLAIFDSMERQQPDAAELFAALPESATAAAAEIIEVG